MLKINLLPRTDRPRGLGAGQGTNVLLFAVVGSLVLLVACLFLFHATKRSELDEIRNSNHQLQGQIDAIKARVADHPRILAELAEIRRREEAISALQAARTGPTAMLVEISRILSPGGHPTADPLVVEPCRRAPQSCSLWNPNWDAHRLWLHELQEENRAIKLSGEGRTPDDVGEFMRRLQLSLYFQQVRLERTEGASNRDNLAVQRFTIQARVIY